MEGLGKDKMAEHLLKFIYSRQSPQVASQIKALPLRGPTDNYQSTGEGRGEDGEIG